MNYRTSRVVWPKIVLLFLAVYRAILPRDRHHQDTSPHVSERLLLSTLFHLFFSPLSLCSSFFSFVLELAPQRKPLRREGISSRRMICRAGRAGRTSQASREGRSRNSPSRYRMPFDSFGREREASLKPYAWNFTPRAVLPQLYCLESSASCCLNCGPWIETKTLSHLPSAIHFGQCCFEPCIVRL